MNKYQNLISDFLEKNDLNQFYQANGRFAEKRYEGNLVFMPNLLEKFQYDVPTIGLPCVLLIDTEKQEISRANFDDGGKCIQLFDFEDA